MKSNLYKLFKIHCYDLLCLLEMEHNGIYFNEQGAMEYARTIEIELDEISRTIIGMVGDSRISLTSGNDISVILYGGFITHTSRVPIGVYKSGQKTGQIRYRINEEHVEYPRRVEPLDKTETANSIKNRENPEKHGYYYWKTDEPTLLKLKADKETKKLITLILKYKELEKLRSSGLQGLSELNKEMNWPENYLFPQYNQCVVVSGRLSCSKPNAQQFDKRTKQFMETRWTSHTRV